MMVPPIIEVAEFEAVQALLRSGSPAWTASRIVSRPTLLTGICFCAAWGMTMTLRADRSGRYRYHTCLTKARQGETGCRGRTVPMEPRTIALLCSRVIVSPFSAGLRSRNLGLAGKTGGYSDERFLFNVDVCLDTHSRPAATAFRNSVFTACR
jgi:hypothetical protein